MTAFAFSRQNVIPLAISLAILAFITVVGIMPPVIKSGELSRQIPVVKAKLDTCKELQALEQTLDARLTELQAFRPQVPFPEIKPLPLQEADTALRTIKDLAVKAGLIVYSLIPEITGAEEKLQTLRIKFKFAGTLRNMRALLMDLIALEYVQELETIHITSGDDNLEFDFRFLIRTM